MRSIVYHQFRRNCISSILQELHIIKTKFCISSLRKLYAPAVMRYKGDNVALDDIQPDG
ncbi:MAG: hypothetical protein IKJ59_07065 [Clostridia bacterium]|nr:hypothetical protein [Clostridia bacterium]